MRSLWGAGMHECGDQHAHEAMVLNAKAKDGNAWGFKCFGFKLHGMWTIFLSVHAIEQCSNIYALNSQGWLA